MAGAFRIAALAAALFALLTVWLLYGDGIPGLVGLGIAISVLILFERNYGVLERMSQIASAAPQFSFVSAIAVLLLLPLAIGSSGYAIHVMTTAFIVSIMAIGLNVHLGGLGLVNIGYGGLFAVGAYTAAILSNQGYPLLIAIALAVVACVVVGILLGLCTIRTTGDYFALVTLGFALIVHQLLINLNWLTAGSNGLSVERLFRSPMNFGFVKLPAEANWYYLTAFSLLFSLFVIYLVNHSWIGRTWSAMREDVIAASCFGVRIPRMRIQTVAFGSAFAGLAGSLFAFQLGFISPDDFTLVHSIELIAMVILGGIGNVWGVVVGAVLLTIIPEKLRILGDYRLLAYGALLVVLLVYRPKGLFPRSN